MNMFCTGCEHTPIDRQGQKEDANSTNLQGDENENHASELERIELSNSARRSETRSAQEALDLKADSAIRFEELKDSGIDFVREDDMRGQCRIFESTGGGVGALDYDRDGLVDLVFMGGCKLPEEADSRNPTCVLYQHRGELKFVDRTVASGLVKDGYCQGIAVGDWDNDGFDDIYITALGPNGFYRNNGDGTFSERTDEMGVRVPEWSTSCAMADLNLDGNLDLYVVNYLADSITDPLLCSNPRSPSGREQCPPSKYRGVDDRIFLNDGAGGAKDVTNQCGLAGLEGKGLGVLISDLDRDGTPEIYVANDGQANFLFKIAISDSGSIALEDHAFDAGAALSRSGYAQASMGIAAGDFDNNGTMDLHLTNFYGDTNTIYKNQGDLRFADVTRSTGIASPSKSVLGWGTVFVDFDQDGWLDLFVTNGHVEDRTWAERGEPFAMRPLLLRNLGNGQFQDVTKFAGEYFEKEWLGRGVVAIDLNQDGLEDLVVSHQLARPQILINKTWTPKASRIELIGVQSNRNGAGGKLEYLGGLGEVLGYREMYGGGSYLSSAVPRQIFAPPGSQKVRVVWPSGKADEFTLKESAIVHLKESR
ncbi:CRTAC1 family protein [Pirellulaceae bacterium SH449]